MALKVVGSNPIIRPKTSDTRLFGEIGRRNRFKICFSLKVLVQVQH